MDKIEKFLTDKLQKRKEEHTFRSLSSSFPPIDFCSNDYLGLAKSNLLKLSINQTLNALPENANGSGGSRLLSGNNSFIEDTERYIADFHLAESGLIFNSGYDANVGLLASVPQRGDTIITDELIHASIIDGCRLSHANRYKFAHNDLNDLEEKLKISKGNVFVVVESVYSMDGDAAPLLDISSLCETYNANLIVDEAHATGVFGDHGQGLIHKLNLQNKVFARIVTFGKAIGIHGAIVLGSNNLRNYLINFARSFIYTTAAPIHNIVAVKCAYQLLNEHDINTLHHKINLFKEETANQRISILPSESAIQGILFLSGEATKNAAQKLQDFGFDVRAILSPTVAYGRERLRICLHIFNSDQEIVSLIHHLKEILNG